MVRFSCFNAHIHSHKQKKTVEPSVEATGGTSSNNLTVKDPKTAMNSSLNSVFLKAFSNGQATEGTDDVRSSISFDRSCKSEEVKGKFNVNGDLEVKMGLLKKSRSLGSGLCHEGRAICDNDTQEETDRGFSSDSPGQNGLVEPKCSKSPCLSPTSEHHEPPQSESVQVGSDFVNESSFSMGDPKHSEKDKLENYDSPISGEVVNESANHVSSIPRNAHMIVKSHSLPSIRHSTPTSDVYSYKYLPPHSRSSEDLRVLEMKSKEVSFHEAERWVMQNRERDDVLCETERSIFDNYVDDGYDTYDYSPLAKDWIMPVTDEVNMTKNIQGESSYQQSEESPGKDFKTKRILEWVNDLSHCSPLEENDVLSESDDPAKQDSSYSNGLAATKMDNKVTSPGMEAAKRYISSLNASAATAQLSNHGLVVIPFLSAFASMRVLSLSGNSIVRITAGDLPRGLHVLNLSKNSISTIEGLRDLTRLRVLDLSYNRILRIGHGLASCSSLKELYLAGNKISEVEGLHRLLKLAVLDLRFNKISTAKCLGQLAANYNSIQAISLEGNPAQKNVGDEQLKKYLQGLLPHLVYFNRQPIKVSTLKDAADRSVRLGMSGHQLDRGLRSDKGARKANHGSRPSSSAIHGRKNQATDSPKRSRGRHVRLPPPSGTRPVASRHQNFDLANKILQLKSEFSMRRSRSEGTLGAF